MKTKLANSKSESKLFVFDLDHTLIQANCSYHFGLYLFKKKLLPLNRLLRLLSLYGFHKLGLIGMRYLHQATFNHFFHGLSANLIDQQAEQFIQKQIKNLIYKPAFEHLLEAQKKGYYTAIFSASPDFLVGKIANYFQVSSWKSTLYQRDNLNHFSKITYVMEGEQKAESLTALMQELNLDKSEITAYSDSYLDLPLLTAVGHPIAVRPDKKLKAICLQKQWSIL